MGRGSFCGRSDEMATAGALGVPCHPSWLLRACRLGLGQCLVAGSVLQRRSRAGCSPSVPSIQGHSAALPGGQKAWPHGFPPDLPCICWPLRIATEKDESIVNASFLAYFSNAKLNALFVSY